MDIARLPLYAVLFAWVLGWLSFLEVIRRPKLPKKLRTRNPRFERIRGRISWLVSKVTFPWRKLRELFKRLTYREMTPERVKKQEKRRVRRVKYRAIFRHLSPVLLCFGLIVLSAVMSSDERFLFPSAVCYLVAVGTFGNSVHGAETRSFWLTITDARYKQPIFRLFYHVFHILLGVMMIAQYFRLR